MPEIAVGLAGYGLAGSVFHAPLIAAAPRMRLAAVHTSRDVPGLPVVRDYRALLDNPDISLIVIATPTVTHFEMVQAALTAGKHVVVDKPFTATAAQADELIALARRERRVLSVFQNRRWDSGFLTLRRCLPELGTVYHFEAHFDRFRPQLKGGWREQPGPGAGMLYDLGAHRVDQALQLFGMPRAVITDAFPQRPGAETVDYFHLLLDYGKRRAVLQGSLLVRQPGPHLMLHGDGGSFIKFGVDCQEDALKSGMRPGHPDWGLEVPARPAELTLADGTRREVETERGRWECYYPGIADAILNGGAAPVDPADSRDGLRVIEAAIQSAAQRKSINFGDTLETGGKPGL